MMAYLGAGRYDMVGRVLAEMEIAAASSDTNGMMTKEVGLPLALGFTAFERGDYGEAIDQLTDLRLKAHRFGGSNAQRDVIDLTLIEAALRGKHRARARALAAERLAFKPQSAGNQCLAQRAHAL